MEPETETVEPAAEELAADTADQDTQPTEVAGFSGDFASLDLDDCPMVIRAAAYLIRRDGWQRGMYKNSETGARCAYGALRDVYDLAGAPADAGMPAYARHGSSYYGIAQYLERRSDEWNHDSVVGFNDGGASGAEDVLAFLDRAADEYDPTLNPYALRPGTAYWEMTSGDDKKAEALAAE